MVARKPLEVGTRFSRLVVIDTAPPQKNYKNDNIYRVLTRCDCGRNAIVPEYKLRAKHTKSCGCLGIEASKKNLPKPTHQKTGTPEYRTWQGMRARCGYTNTAPEFTKHYAGRGIKICERWDHFENFLEDMGLRPDKNYSIERKDVNGDYSPDNCIWADWFTQSRNRRNNVKVILYGKEVCVSEACDIMQTHQNKIIRMVRKFEITHQKAVDIYSSSPKNYTFRDFKKILDQEYFDRLQAWTL